METPLPASQGAQQPERLAVSRRLSCGLCTLVLCLRHSDVYFWEGSARKLPKTMFPPQSEQQNIRAS